MKSETQILAEELGKMLTSPQMEKIRILMDNVNPCGLCLSCATPVGTGHLLCPECYLREGVNMK